MSFTFEQLAAIYRVSIYLMRADGQLDTVEVAPFRCFLQSFEGFGQEQVDLVLNIAVNELSDERALQIIALLGEDEKAEVSALFAKVVVADGEYTAKEQEMLEALIGACGLPVPVIPGYGEDKADPTFLIARTNGTLGACFTSTNDWSEVGPALSEALGADRLEVVRFTPRLNELTARLCLVNCHLVFLMDRNAAMRADARDNMTGTILYGTGYEIMGDIAFALESDKGYEIMGIESISLVDDVFNWVNDAVGGLLRVEE